MDIFSHVGKKDQEGAASLLAQVQRENGTPALEVKLSGADNSLKLSEEGSAFFWKC